MMKWSQMMKIKSGGGKRRRISDLDSERPPLEAAGLAVTRAPSSLQRQMKTETDDDVTTSGGAISQMLQFFFFFSGWREPVNERADATSTENTRSRQGTEH